MPTYTKVKYHSWHKEGTWSINKWYLSICFLELYTYKDIWVIVTTVIIETSKQEVNLFGSIQFRIWSTHPRSIWLIQAYLQLIYHIEAGLKSYRCSYYPTEPIKWTWTFIGDLWANTDQYLGVWLAIKIPYDDFTKSRPSLHSQILLNCMYRCR